MVEKKNLVSEMAIPQRRQLIDFENKTLPISQQAVLLDVSRSSLYYRPIPPDAQDLSIKKHIDEIYTAHPEYGYRRITKWLARHHNLCVNHKAVLRHMREMGIQAVYPRQSTSKPATSNLIYPYLLKGLEISRPNQVWSIDITYIPINSSWLYLVAIIDWYSRYVLSWRLDDTLDIGFVLEASRTALKTAVPDIMNSDQGSHFTSPKYIKIFQDAGAKISMDHRDRAFDNIFIERFWRTVKYENVYLKEYSSPKEAYQGLSEYMRYYNWERMHQSLNYHTPEEVHFITSR